MVECAVQRCLTPVALCGCSSFAASVSCSDLCANTSAKTVCVGNSVRVFRCVGKDGERLSRPMPLSSRAMLLLHERGGLGGQPSAQPPDANWRRCGTARSTTPRNAARSLPCAARLRPLSSDIQRPVGTSSETKSGLLLQG
jgi:hypothetical protein